jgi:hypothetical protein
MTAAKIKIEIRSVQQHSQVRFPETRDLIDQGEVRESAGLDKLCAATASRRVELHELYSTSTFPRLIRKPRQTIAVQRRPLHVHVWVD